MKLSKSNGYFNISYSSKQTRLGSQSYKYIMRLDEYNNRSELVNFGYINEPKIYESLEISKREEMLQYYLDFEKYSRVNSTISINLIAMIPREFGSKYNEEDLSKLYSDIGYNLTNRLINYLSKDSELHHIGVYGIHNPTSLIDNLHNPHIHIQISSHMYSSDILGREDITSYDLISGGIVNSELQKVSTYYNFRDIFSDCMNEYLEREGFNSRFSGKSLGRLLREQDVDRDLLGVIYSLKSSTRQDTSLSALERSYNLDIYNDSIEILRTQSNIQEYIKDEIRNSKLSNEVIHNDEYLLSLMEKRVRLYNSLLNEEESIYSVNGSDDYKSFTLARDIDKGIPVEEYLRTNRLILKLDEIEDISVKNKGYYKIGNILDILNLLKDDIKLEELGKYGYTDKIIELMYKKMILRDCNNIIYIHNNMEELLKSDKRIGNLDISLDMNNIKNKKINKLLKLIELDGYIQKGLNNRNSDSLLVKVYNGEIITDILDGSEVKLSDFTDNVKICGKSYSEAVSILKLLEEDIQNDRDNKELLENISLLKRELDSSRVQEAIEIAKSKYTKELNLRKDLIKDINKKDKIQDIVERYRSSYLDSILEDSVVGEILDKYNDDSRLSDYLVKKDILDVINVER